MSLLSIIIPTHRRATILKRCLEHIEAQSIRSALDIIVVSDGRDPETASMLSSMNLSTPMKFLEIEKSHQGRARNRGVAEAKTPYCLFIGDDIFLDQHACAHHVHLLEQSGPSALLAVLGHTTWNSALPITPTMRWLERSGWQFGYPLIRKHQFHFLPEGIQHRFTYTSHLSVPTHIARTYPFRDDVLLYGWEDIEWGKRLADAQVRLYYEPRARAIHHHLITEADSLKRMETLGSSLEQFPHLDRRPQGMKYGLYHLAALFPTHAGRHRRAFLRGMKRTRN